MPEDLVLLQALTSHFCARSKNHNLLFSSLVYNLMDRKENGEKQRKKK